MAIATRALDSICSTSSASNLCSRMPFPASLSTLSVQGLHSQRRLLSVSRKFGKERMPGGARSVSAALDCAKISRREAICVSGPNLGALILFLSTSTAEKATASDYTDMPALRGKDYGKSKMLYPDYIMTTSGLQYKDLRDGGGANPQEGDQVVVDWAGYTIGYYGRIFEARNKAKGGSFEGNERDYFKFKLGDDEVIPAFEEAIKTMRVGGVRRIIVPVDLGYPNNDYNSKGPRPATFSGQRALDFVLRNNGLIDKTLLFDIELLKVVGK